MIILKVCCYSEAYCRDKMTGGLFHHLVTWNSLTPLIINVIIMLLPVAVVSENLQNSVSLKLTQTFSDQ